MCYHTLLLNMSRLNIEKISRIHFIGIGGIGMSALARHFLHEKKTVSGSDRASSELTATLQTEGVKVYTEQTAENITKDIELVIYTEAVTPESEGWPELEQARTLGIPTLNYFDALGHAMNPYYLIAVAGTHGKTTTTAMLTDIFEADEKDPTAVIGSLRAKTKSNYRAGKSKFALVEACEYKRDFLSLKPDVLIITNLEHEHVDCYPTLEDVQDAFRTLVGQVHDTGVVIANPKDPKVAPVLADSHVPVMNYMEYLDLALSLKQPGLHNRMNAAAALAAARHEKVEATVGKTALEQFAGTWRRFEYKGECNQAHVYDDYAHHPTEIRGSIEAARELHPDRRLVVVFQPHTYSRTKTLFAEFAKALGLADEIYLLPIYSAREENESGVSSRELSVKVLEYNQAAYYLETMEQAVKKLRSKLTDTDVLLVMGAGDVTQVAKALTE